MSWLGDVGTVMFGGLGKSTNPNDYGVNNPQQQQINAAMGNYGNVAGQINGMVGQQAAQVNPAQQAQFRQMQMQQAQQLQGIASGTQEGAGELAAQRQVQNAVAAQQAQARMARGGANSALAFRGAANNMANVGLQGAGQAQQAALQDQQTAQGQLSNVLNQGRGQDLSLGTTNAQLQQNQYGQNLNAMGSMYGQNLNALTGLNQQQLTAATGSMNATLGQQGVAGELLNAAGQVGAAAMKAAPAAAASDRNLKTDIDEDASETIDEMLNRLTGKKPAKRDDDEMDELMSGLKPVAYRYRDEKYGKGRRVGIMAQNMMTSKAGARVVRADPDGLKLDVNKAISAALAATARLHQRMGKLEKRVA